MKGQNFKNLLFVSAYIRCMVLIILCVILNVTVIHYAMTGIRASSKQLEIKLKTINSQLDRYENQRDQINSDYSKFTAFAQQASLLEKQISQTRSHQVESWLMQLAMRHNLQPRQIIVTQRVTDLNGVFFRISIKITGFQRNIQVFLDKILSSEYFLIWENISFEVVDSNELQLAMSLKHYIEVSNEISSAN